MVETEKSKDITYTHAVFDTKSLANQSLGERVEATRDKGEKINKRNIEIDKQVKPSEANNLFNPQYQVGAIKGTKWFEGELIKLRSNFVFRVFPADEKPELFLKRKMLYIAKTRINVEDNQPYKELVKITAYTWPVIPEHSIYGHTEQVIYEPNVYHYDKTMIDKEGNDKTKKKGLAPFAEVIRGYRQVLALLIRMRILSKEEVLRVFGNSNRQDWKFCLEGSGPNPWLQPK